MSTIFYRLPDECEESYYEMESDWDIGESETQRGWLAEAAGQDYWSNHDGWEDTWPMTFSLHQHEGGPELARYSVNMEGVPTFYSSSVEKGNE